MMNAAKYLIFVSILSLLMWGCSSSVTQNANSDFLSATTSFECRGIKVITVKENNDIELIPDALPPEMREGYALFKEHCVKCHPQGRAIGFLRDCRFDTTQNYISNIKVTVMKKIRMTSVDISKADGKKIYEFLIGLFELGKNNAGYL